MPTFTGPAFYTEKAHFDKFDFNDLDKKIKDTKQNDATFTRGFKKKSSLVQEI